MNLTLYVVCSYLLSKLHISYSNTARLLKSCIIIVKTKNIVDYSNLGYKTLDLHIFRLEHIRFPEQHIKYLLDFRVNIQKLIIMQKHNFIGKSVYLILKNILW